MQTGHFNPSTNALTPTVFEKNADKATCIKIKDRCQIRNQHQQEIKIV